MTATFAPQGEYDNFYHLSADSDVFVFSPGTDANYQAIIASPSVKEAVIADIKKIVGDKAVVIAPPNFIIFRLYQNPITLVTNIQDTLKLSTVIT